LNKHLESACFKDDPAALEALNFNSNSNCSISSNCSDNLAKSNNSNTATATNNNNVMITSFIGATQATAGMTALQHTATNNNNNLSTTSNTTLSTLAKLNPTVQLAVNFAG